MSDVISGSARSTLNLEFFVALSTVARVWRKHADLLLREYELSDALAWPLVLLYRAQHPLRVQDLAEQLGLDSSSLVRPLDQLCAARLMTREEDPSDRRAKKLELTPAGRELASRISDTVNVYRDRVMRGIEEADLKVAVDVARRVEARLERGRP